MAVGAFNLVLVDEIGSRPEDGPAMAMANVHCLAEADDIPRMIYSR
jgi:hypothetical protein